MASQTIAGTGSRLTGSFLSRRLHAMSLTLAAWRERRRRRSDAALLMGLESYMLQDIGVSLTECRGSGALLQWQPAEPDWDDGNELSLRSPSRPPAGDRTSF